MSAKPLLLDGLRRLEYRGYDSAGIALREDGRARRTSARSATSTKLGRGRPERLAAHHGLGHTRWATHGAVTESNAHPLIGCDAGGSRSSSTGSSRTTWSCETELHRAGHTFTSETDAEVVVHLLEREYDGDLAQALARVYPQLEGHFSIVAIHHDQPDLLAGVRHQTPLVVGLGEGENFLASSIAAFLSETRSVIHPADGQVIEITPEGVRVRRRRGGRRTPSRARRSTGTSRAPRRAASRRSCSRRSTSSPRRCGRRSATASAARKLMLEALGMTEDEVRNLRRIVIVACGTAYHAGVVGRYIIEEWARVPVELDIASEWIYRNPVLSKDTLVIGISQSGETRDTVNAVKLAREAARGRSRSRTSWGRRSRARSTRRCTRAAGWRSASPRRRRSPRRSRSVPARRSGSPRSAARCRRTRSSSSSTASTSCPRRCRSSSTATTRSIRSPQRFHEQPFFLYLGRHIGLPVALEGALKLKEISYIPTEAYSAGEMKHGPIALLDEGTPVVVVATNIHVYDKIVSNIQETRARGAHVIAIATDGNEDIQHHADDVIYVPRTPNFLQAPLAVMPLQLLAYKIARLRGLNVDQPRNLAKTVTVE